MTANPKPQPILPRQYWGRLTMDQCSARADLVNLLGLIEWYERSGMDAIESGAAYLGLTWCANSLGLADSNGRVDHPPPKGDYHHGLCAIVRDLVNRHGTGTVCGTDSQSSAVSKPHSAANHRPPFINTGTRVAQAP
ncbi:unnamed protein product [Clonostachys solani]|uniref:Uncharacterized protein n=1 Tax=Clonostachys solani TaxID=160281 RepID=A0A9P0EAY6_9HYPO|nr:unnamed protein product [Clonostachys solani]